MNAKILAEKAKNKLSNKGKVENRVGPSPDGPKLCMHCHKPFAKGEAWQRLTSPPDPEFGSYTVGIHEKCLGTTAEAK